MSELLLINPRKRRKAKRASPARRRVRAKRRTVRRTNPIAPAFVARRRRRVSAVRKSNPRRRKSYRRNPIAGLSVNSITGMAKGAAVGAVGALAVDVAFGYVKSFLPASMQAPQDISGSVNPMYFLAKGGVAVLLGVLGKKLTKHAGHMAEGSLTVTMYDLLKGFVPSSVQLGYISPGHMAGTRRQQAFQGQRMNEYVGMSGVSGYQSPSAREASSVGEYAYR